MTTYNRLEKMEKLKGYPFDEFRCFYIKDFKRGDSIRLRENRRSPIIRGVVTGIDLETNVISYKTAEKEKNETTINRIVTLEEYRNNWLEE